MNPKKSAKHNVSDNFQNDDKVGVAMIWRFQQLIKDDWKKWLGEMVVMQNFCAEDEFSDAWSKPAVCASFFTTAQLSYFSCHF